jgi:hypothetical protein
VNADHEKDSKGKLKKENDPERLVLKTAPRIKAILTGVLDEIPVQD